MNKQNSFMYIIKFSEEIKTRNKTRNKTRKLIKQEINRQTDRIAIILNTIS